MLEGSANTGQTNPPSSNQMGIEFMIFERLNLPSSGLSEDSISTLMAARKPNTLQRYFTVWDQFSKWCKENKTDPLDTSEVSVVEFLQKGVELKLSISTLKSHVTAISHFSKVSWAHKPLVKRFFLGLKKTSPVNRTQVPPWALCLVLDALTCEPFQPIETIPIKTLNLKMRFLLAITTARRVGELQALSGTEGKLTFIQDRVVQGCFSPKANN
ncbi:hypothetical protein XELAEV_18010615mg [Xenopus laevis]|uniref:Core-binding (CB) domain-containing protein n=1 Tax=Xenopus laevis TaxID=8355 RepID=A0A974DUU4_XENLA|nr:hypothetical protein XELAEV_18010615mg [Xenopus laevis]